MNQGLRYGPPEEGSPSLNQLEAESFSESSSDADYASPISSFEVPYVEDASFIFENFERISAQFNGMNICYFACEKLCDIHVNASCITNKIGETVFLFFIGKKVTELI